MKVLVTGGAGFIGSHACLLLLEKGYEVVVIDSYINSNKKSINRVIEILNLNNKINNFNIKVFNADIRDEKLLDKLFFDSIKIGKPFQAVVHFAGLKSVKDSLLNPLIYWDINFAGSIKLLKVMEKYNCRTIIFSSSATIYRHSNNKLLSENTVIDPINPYGRTKAAVEALLNDIFKSNKNKWRIANLRYFNPIGAHPSGMIGEDPKGIPNNIFPYISKVAAGKLEELVVFGNDWPTFDGTGVRDYIHVMDLVEGHVRTLEYLIDNNPKIINLNLGTGIGTSVLELVKTFESVNNVKIPYRISSRRKGDNSICIADSSLAFSYLNWMPKRTLQEMCSDGWKWQLLNPEGYR